MFITSNRLSQALTACLVAITLCAANAARAQVAAQSGAPAGFEALEAPRRTFVILYYGGNEVGPVAAHMSPGRLTFDRPDQVADKLPMLVDRQKVVWALSQPLEAHADLLCGKRTDDCGKLTPDVAGVIFDENSLVAELFINKAYLGVADANRERFLPLPDKKLSSISSFSGAVNGADAHSPSFSLSNANVVAFGEARLAAQVTAANTGLRFDTAAATIEREGWDSTAGLFRSHAQQLLSDRDIAGAAYSTSMRTWTDAQKVKGNDVILYLPRRAYVSIYREGRLYSSQAYEAGNQTIDTSELPDGAYEITLKIQDSNGEVREEKRFFAKTQDIPPPDRPTYYVEGGLIRKPAGEDTALPEVTAKPILRAGTVHRLADNVGVNMSFTAVEDRALMEAGTTWIEPGMKLSASALASTRDDFGIQATWIETLGDFNASVDARKTWMNPKPIPGFEDQSMNMTEVSATLGYMLTADLSFGLRGSYVRQDMLPLLTSVGPFAEWRLWSAGESALGFTLAAARTDHDNEASALLHFSYKLGDYTVSGAGGASYDQLRAMPTGNLHVSHTDLTPGNQLTLGGGVSADTRQQVFSSDADWRTDVGSLMGSVQEAMGKAGNSLGYAGNFAVNATQLEGDVLVGGADDGKSAAVVEIDGDADAEMKIMVNDVDRAHVMPGSRQVVYLTPFHTYQIRIAPLKTGLLDYESASRRVTVYSGNVVKLKWSVNKFYVVSARIVTPEGTPLSGWTLEESRAQVATDEKGRVQAELSSPKSLTFDGDAGKKCRVDLPAGAAKTINGVMLYHDALACVAVGS